MKKIIQSIFVALIVTACHNDIKNEIDYPKPDSPSPSGLISSTATSTTEYSIINIDLNNRRAFNASVSITSKISNNELIVVAKRVKEDIGFVSDNGVIFFYLSEMKVNNGAWAAVDFEPAPKVRIIGQSIKDEHEIKSNLENIKNDVGLWADNGTKGDIAIRIRKDKNVGYVFEYVNPANPIPSDLATPIIKITQKGKTIFKDTEHQGEYFLVESNGNLSVYDNDGFVTTYKRLK